ncbi:Catalase related subgroup [Segniliparus rotundus DSM 44985]|uniref:Catalase-related peroxidase n=1 Tax=Segniliparus rotundus (strain ATCC BAA-972 / CDC 1076 / CIP 108378 / DSM 44985 / JCM 13578) TaxID=640132 RepID=D6ZBP4_SEGRD|nr:catalase family peroxidase [Segniliparus rotundus]ADG98996.1 Catalase related subgroup [Segniliparus rotundus DSM 44985]
MVSQPLARRPLLGFLAAGGVALAGFGGFLYAEGRVDPARLTARKFIDLFESLGGRFAGYRRNHAKALVVAGWFESNGAGSEVASASVFQKGRHALLGRFSVGGQNPHAKDALGQGRGLGLIFSLPDGEQWRSAMVNAPVFPAPTPEAFYEFTIANAPVPATGKPDPGKRAAYLNAHPSSAAALKIIQSASPAPTFATSTFHSVHTFIAVDGSGARTPVRWQLVPQSDERAAPDHNGPDWLFRDLAKTLRQGPVRFSLVLLVGVAGQDPTNDPTQPWPADRRRIDAGTVVLGPASLAQQERARDQNFDPTVLPAGIEPSDDPILAARAAIYAESYRRRSAETPAPVQKFDEEA